MRKSIIHAAGVGLGVCGLAVALAPAAGATPKPPTVTKPVTQRVSFNSAFEINDPCNGVPVSTTGHANSVTVTTGQRTAAVVTDSESGGGFSMGEVGAGTFNALASTYTFTAQGIWIDTKHLADSFHASLTVTVYVTSTNAPYAFSSTQNIVECGL